MSEKKELYELLEFLIGYDISFVIKDIIGTNFEDIEIPSNVDEEDWTQEVNTPHGLFTIHIINKEKKKEVKFMHYIGNTFYEEYRLDLYPSSNFCYHLDGKTVEFREKGFIINNIDKDYVFDLENNRISSLSEIIKLMEVFPLSELKQRRTYGNAPVDASSLNIQTLLPIIGHVGEDYEIYFCNSLYDKDIAISVRIPNVIYALRAHPRITIDGHDISCYIVTDENVVGRTYDLFEGIVTKENYQEALNLANRGEFNRYFAYFDWKEKDDAKSINEIVDELIGRGLPNYKREYSAYVRKVVDEYYNYIKNNPFLFDEHSSSYTDKKRELEKNNYIKEILLRNKEN